MPTMNKGPIQGMLKVLGYVGSAPHVRLSIFGAAQGLLENTKTPMPTMNKGP